MMFKIRLYTGSSWLLVRQIIDVFATWYLTPGASSDIYCFFPRAPHYDTIADNHCEEKDEVRYR